MRKYILVGGFVYNELLIGIWRLLENDICEFN